MHVCVCVCMKEVSWGSKPRYSSGQTVSSSPNGCPSYPSYRCQLSLLCFKLIHTYITAHIFFSSIHSDLFHKVYICNLYQLYPYSPLGVTVPPASFVPVSVSVWHTTRQRTAVCCACFLFFLSFFQHPSRQESMQHLPIFGCNSALTIAFSRLFFPRLSLWNAILIPQHLSVNQKTLGKSDVHPRCAVCCAYSSTELT